MTTPSTTAAYDQLQALATDGVRVPAAIYQRARELRTPRLLAAALAWSWWWAHQTDQRCWCDDEG